MPELKKRKLNLTESSLLGEVEKVHLPRDKKGRFVSTSKEKPRSIKLVKVKGSYGTFVVKEKMVPDEVRTIIFGVALLGIILSVL